ncbi:hypothetical protein HDF24_03240 [Mucilaginibacter sp. X4EP1]|uniref:hypothetical protein n=1 Tax=Mucilaginibacter sp. X4EP1 TaxID=2723092 RepID=UPI00216797A2|nr:hypothetical protein [Mucilaginibacter sp. X4EP1]MCS3812040.1 hypothetical protein [Mucilaginibacter sp. X4EP1]
MDYEEAKQAVKSKRHFLLHTHKGTTDWVLMDLYIAYQDSTEDAVEQRAYLKEQISAIVDAHISWKTTDHTYYEIESTAPRYIDSDVLEVLNYILTPDHPRPLFIPQIFSKRIEGIGRELSVTGFYKYR